MCVASICLRSWTNRRRTRVCRSIFFDTYYMAGMVQEIVPVQRFFRDRYFPTNAATDIFNANKVLVEYQDGDREMAPFVVRRAG